MPVWVYPSGIKRSQARKEKTATSKGARSKEPGVKSQSQKKNKMRLSKPIEPEAKPPPPPTAVYGLPGLSPCPVFPSLAGYGFPFLAGAPPVLRRSPPSAVGFSLARRVGFSRSWAVSVFPRSAVGGGGGLASGLCALPGLLCVPGLLRVPLILLETTQTF